MARRHYTLPLILLACSWLAATPRAAETDRLVTLARVWATAKYLHPVMLEKDVDWDGALVRAIPKARAATTDDGFAAAVGSMLSELGDPSTRVVRATTTTTRPAGDVPLLKRDGEILVLNAGPYANARGLMAFYSDQARLPGEIAKARQLVIDVRNHADDPDEAAFVAGLVSQLGGLTSERLAAPSSRVVLHSGYSPQTGSTSGGYYSAFMTLPGAVYPAAPGAAPSRVVFVTDAQSALPAIALPLRNAGKALIVSDTPLEAGALARKRHVTLPGNWRALIRVEDVIVPFEADVIASDPMAEALAIVQGKKSAPAVHHKTPATTPSEPRVVPDRDYKEMAYPDIEHRLLAAFRIWSIIDYFYPYKPLIGDWDEAFTASIPSFIAAANADEYAQAVAQMVALVEDGHSSAFGHPSMAKIIAMARLPIEVRQVEEEIVITRLYGPPAGADLRVGDVVVSVDGEPVRARMDRLRKYVTASTEVSRTNRLAAAALQGPPNSTATMVVRGADMRDRTVPIPRIPPAPRPPPQDPVYRVLDGNIGYVNLVRLEVPDVDAMFDAFKGTSAIVFDMRGYPRGTAWSIAPRINTKRAAVGATFRRVQVSGADPSDGSSPRMYFEQRLPPSDKPLYKGKTVMLIDDRAISQSEHTALFFEAANGTTFVGTPTAGANGDVTNFTVPGGFRVSFSGHDVRHADDRQLQRVGIQPHVRVAPTIAGLRAGRDEVLERAIEYLRNGK